jgi:hypothetical protein
LLASLSPLRESCDPIKKARDINVSGFLGGAAGNRTPVR